MFSPIDPKEAQEKSLMWYFHPNEIVRLMRAETYENIDINEDLTPHYDKDNLNIGVVIGTYGATAYIDLSLYYLIKVNGIKNILIHDDHSDEKDKIKEVCKKYVQEDNSVHIDFYTTDKNMWHKSCIGSIGDQNCFYVGLNWAKSKNLDILVKFSRRLIPCYNWINDFKNLVIESDGITFSSYCKKDKFPIRTELLGMNVKAWSNIFVLKMMKWFLQNEFPTFAEFWMDKVAKQLDFQNSSEKYEKYRKEHKTGYLYSGYVHWYDILGTNRYTNEDRKNDQILWHMFKKEEDYLEKANEVLGNKYTLENFKNITNI